MLCKEYEAGVWVQALFSDGGYTYLDVRPKLEVDDIGKVKGSVNVPMANSARKYDPEQRKKVVQNLGKNENFIKEVRYFQLLLCCALGPLGLVVWTQCASICIVHKQH